MKYIFKSLFKVGAKIAKIGRQNCFFDPPKNKKPSVQKFSSYGIYGEFSHLKLICTHQAPQNPRKKYFTSTRLVFGGVWCAWWLQINFKCENSP